MILERVALIPSTWEHQVTVHKKSAEGAAVVQHNPGQCRGRRTAEGIAEQEVVSCMCVWLHSLTLPLPGDLL